MDLIKIDFKADKLEVIGELVVVKDICENIGIEYKRQYKKLQSDSTYQSKLIEVKTNGGIQKVFAIPYEKLNGWLFSINPNRVKPEVREKLIEYKNEAFKVLHDYFNKGYAMKPEIKAELENIIVTQNTTIALLQKQLESKSNQITKRPKKHPMSYLSPVEHNTFLELVFQMLEQKKDIAKFKKVLTQRENNMQNFLNSFVNRYPEAKSYIEKYNT